MATRQKVFEHVVRSVLGLGDDSSLEKALTAENVKILTIFDILGMTENDIDSLEYGYDVDGDGKNIEMRQVSTGYKNLVRVLQDYVAFSEASGFDITVRAQGWILVGHCEHHMTILKDRYGIPAS